MIALPQSSAAYAEFTTFLGMNRKFVLSFVSLTALCLEACDSLGDLTLVDLQPQKVQNELRLVAEYKSNKDLSQFDREMLWGRFFPCERPDARLLLGPLNQERISDPMAPPEKFGPPPYRAVFRVALAENVPSSPPFESFDLRQQPQDVCFRLKKGPYSEIGAWSGILTIPKEKIVSVLSRPEPVVK